MINRYFGVNFDQFEQAGAKKWRGPFLKVKRYNGHQNDSYIDNVLCESFWTKYLFIFDPSKVVLYEWQKMDKEQNLMLFPNMSSEILCVFLFTSSERIFERHEKIVWTEIFFVYFCTFTIVIWNSTLKLSFIYQIVEQILPYKMHFLNFVLF